MPPLTAEYLHKYGSREARLTKVFFQGSERTKQYALLIETQKLFEARTFRDLVTKAYDARCQMQKDGLFEHVEVLIDVDKSLSSKTAHSSDGYEVTFMAKEPSFTQSRIMFDFDNRGQSGLCVSCRGANIFGAGESAYVEASKGSNAWTSFRLGLLKPLLKWRDARITVDLDRYASKCSWSAYDIVKSGAEIALIHEPVHNLITHRLAYSASYRRLELEPDIHLPFAVRKFAGPSLKSSIISSLTLNTTNDSILPTKGTLLKFINEFAGFGGDAKFSKHDILCNISRSLSSNTILSLGGRLTYVRAANSQPLSPLDRTYLGGANDLRGFACRSVGPKEQNAYLGGCASWCLAFHIYRRLWPSFLYAHSFLTFGDIFQTIRSKNHDQTWRRYVENNFNHRPRFACGFGLAAKVFSMKLELNFCRPLWFYPVDTPNFGVQFGIGFDFI